MTMTTMPPAITGGVDTHLDVHVAAALDSTGGLLGVESFPTTTAGYRQLRSWLRSFGRVERVGIEGTTPRATPSAMQPVSPAATALGSPATSTPRA
jgi:hypothetical protein